MLRDEVEQYTKLTGEDGWKVPIMKVGAYLDGYNKRLEVLDKIRAEIMQLDYDLESVDYDYNDMAQTEMVHMICREEVLQILDKYKESEDINLD